MTVTARKFLVVKDGNPPEYNHPWRELARFLEAGCSEEEFAEWVNRRRGERALENDDVALLAIELCVAKNEGRLYDC